ncbi:TonB family protein [Desulfurispira natronophila]|uniref:TonB family protein n=1 Tax=Desulfurispira natronophila TaxID=682562 RepID=A0A7W7Y611_9BACT|nr:TonB family protein [Desulfurispira natronophila]MBB5022569.1 TonB family protein [Desulfurispira natronophila]
MTALRFSWPSALPSLPLPGATAVSVALHVLFFSVYLLVGSLSPSQPPVVPNVRVQLMPQIAEQTAVADETPQREVPVVGAGSKQAAPEPAPRPPEEVVRPEVPDPQDLRRDADSAIDRIRQAQQLQRQREAAQQAVERLARQRQQQEHQQEAAPDTEAETQPEAHEEEAATPVAEELPAAEAGEVSTEASWDITSDRAALAYLDAVTATITENFQRRIDFGAHITRDPIVRFTLQRDGRIAEGSIAIQQSSGSQVVDRALILAVQRGGPYPAFPESIQRNTITIDVRGNIHDE